MAVFHYQGHGSYRITTDKGIVIYVDPFAGKGNEVPGDILLVTHEHSDHNQVNLVNLKDGGVLIRERDVLRNGKYLTLEYFGVKITGTPAMNENHDPKICVGYVLEFDNKKIYCAGDTSTTEFMKNILPKYKLDLAVLPCDGVFNMGPEEATKCAEMIKAKISVPVHTKPGFLYGDEIAARFTPSSKALVHPGEEIEF
jgi:L-ascorbate metabolism protein UlaG (beta-lactamase superfamily)